MGIKFDKISISGSVNSLVAPISPEYWIATAGITSLARVTGNITTDSSGNIYTVGVLNNYTLILNKFSPNGSLLWARSLSVNSAFVLSSTNLVVDSLDNLVFVTAQRDSSYTAGTIYAMKISPAGSLLWQKSISQPSSYITAKRVVLHPSDGSIHMVGETYANTYGANDVLYSVISADGATVTNRRIGSSRSELGHGIALDSSANVYFGGYAGGDPFGTTKLMFSKFNSAMGLQYSFSQTTPSDDKSYDVKLINSTVVFVGEQNVSGNRNAMVGRLNSNGLTSWTRTLEGSLIDFFFSVEVDSISGNIYALGYTTSTTTNSLSGILIACYSSSGTLLWQRIVEGPGAAIEPAGICLLGEDMYIAGNAVTGSHLFKLPKDGTLTGIYGGFNYRISSLSGKSLTLNGTTESLSQSTVSYTVSTPSLSLNVATPTSGIISI